MARGLEFTVRSTQEFIRRVIDLAGRWNLAPGDVWFRGMSRQNHRLIPGIYRHRDIEEDSLIEDFVINSRPLLGPRIDDAWEIYALMQHHGLPTRLLDWTKVSLIALYFAVQPERGGTNRVVWAMNPYELNLLTQGRPFVWVPSKDRPVQEGLRIFEYLPKALRSDDVPAVPARPCAIEPELTNRRILFQQGCFTVHGSESRSLESYFPETRTSKIAKITIRGRHVRNAIWEDLQYLGFREDYVYQDLESLSERLKREHNC